MTDGMRTVTAIYTPEDDGWLSVKLLETLDGCLVTTQGKGLQQTRSRLYEAMETALFDPSWMDRILILETMAK